MPQELIRRNRAWAEAQNARSRDYFPALARIQNPEYFWIGCSDARVPANVIAGLQPGEVFVHRNVANVVHSSDLNLLSALQFAIDGLHIRKVIVCGHYGCGGVQAACDNKEHGLIDHWIEPIRRLSRAHREQLSALSGEVERLDRLAELNVMASVQRVAETPIVRTAWARGMALEIHGMIYALNDGRLHLLDCSLDRDVRVE